MKQVNKWFLLELLNSAVAPTPPPIMEVRVICDDTQERRIVSADTDESRVT